MAAVNQDNTYRKGFWRTQGVTDVVGHAPPGCGLGFLLATRVEVTWTFEGKVNLVLNAGYNRALCDNRRETEDHGRNRGQASEGGPKHTTEQ